MHDSHPARLQLRFAAALSLGILAPAASAAILAITAASDATLYEETSPSATANGAGEFLLAGRTNQASNSRRHSLIRFDLTALPAGASISSATLNLHLIAVNTTATTLGLHRVTTAWTEGPADPAGNESSGVAASTGDTSWVSASQPGAPWTVPGGDALSPASATAVVGSAAGLVSWSSPGMLADVESWIADPAANFGWLLRDPETTPQTAKRFASSENADPLLRPELVIEFTAVPEASTAWLLGTSVLLACRRRRSHPA